MLCLLKKFIPALLPFVAVILFTSEQFSDDGRAGYTGSPGETDCTTCHASFPVNSGGGSITFQNPGMPLNEYIAGQTYAMSVTVSRTSNNLFGFGFEALTNLNDNAGTLLITDAASTQIKTRVVTSVTRRNVVHQLNAGAASGSKTFNFSWTAPASGSGPVGFYFAGVAADGNANDNNDYVYKSNLTVTEQLCPVPNQPNPISGSSNICRGATQNYSINPVVGATSYTWIVPTGWIGTSSSNSISVVTNSTSGTVQVVANNSCGSSLPVTLFVTVTNTMANAGSDQTICEGSSISLGGNPSASGGVTPYTYSWSPALSLNDSTAANPLSTISNATGFSLTVTDFNGCTATDNIFIYILPAPPLSIALVNDTFFASLNGTIQWFLNSSILAADTLSYFVPDSSGIYQASTTYQNGCTVYSNNLIFNTVGIKEQEIDPLFNIFPNPAKNQLNIHTPEALLPLTLKIFQLNGSILLDVHLQDQSNIVNISEFTEGIYIMMLKHDSIIRYQKFTIIR